jgi:3-oxoacyl-[acyl-carrier-protein] synthase-1
MKPISILGCGMVTGVGLDAQSSCAAMRAAISAFAETRFGGPGGEWLIGSQVRLEKPWRGISKLVRLAAPAIQECLAAAGKTKPETIPILLCIAEKERPGRLTGLDDQLMPALQTTLSVRPHPRSQVFARGRMGGAEAVDLARKMIYDERMPRCIVAGVDSFLVGPMLSAYMEKFRLLTESNSNGFIPGEAGAAVLLGPPDTESPADFRCLAVGFGHERATIDSDEPLRANGLVEAFRALYRDGGMTLDDAQYRYTDCNGEQYGFKEDQLAISRTVRKLKSRFDHLHPADSIGEVGAAVVPCVLGLALTAARKGYAPGDGVLCHFSNDAGDRAAMLLRYIEKDGSR